MEETGEPGENHRHTPSHWQLGKFYSNHLSHDTYFLCLQDQDGADDLLKAENQHLRNLKRMLEAQLRLVQQQLQALDAARRRLANVVQERSRVLDLICHTLSNAPLPPPRITRHNSTARSGYGRSSALSMSGGQQYRPSGGLHARGRSRPRGVARRLPSLRTDEARSPRRH